MLIFTYVTSFYTIVPMPFRAWKGQRALIFIPWSFFFVKSFYHITKYASVFHLKLNVSCRLSYFTTFTSSKHTSHHHGQSIASCQFLTYKYDWSTTSGWLQTLVIDIERFSHLLWVTLSQLDNLSLYFFKNFTPLYIFLIYDVFFFNKANQVVVTSPIH